MTNEEKISYFAFELSEIKDENLKKFLTIILAQLVEYVSSLNWQIIIKGGIKII